MASFTPMGYRRQSLVIQICPFPHQSLLPSLRHSSKATRHSGQRDPPPIFRSRVSELYTDPGCASCDPDAEDAVMCCQQNQSKQICLLAVLAPRTKSRHVDCELRIPGSFQGEQG